MSDAVHQKVDRLLKDREKYEAWLKRLESEKATTTERAYERVRADYQRRLDEVTSSLRAHGEAIQSKLRELESKTASLDNERLIRAERLDEAQLRRSVGEYRDDNEWAEIEARMLGEVRAVERELEAARAEFGRLREIVAVVQGAEARPAPQPQPAPQPAAQPQPSPAAPPPPPSPPPSPPRPAVQPVGGAAGGDEGFLSLEELVLEDKEPPVVMGQPAPPAPPAPPPAADPFAEAAGEPPPTEGGVTDELAFLESLSLSGGGGEQPDSFSFLEQHGSGTPQTIICPHCSAANDPAEWYCTECGEELPAE